MKKLIVITSALALAALSSMAQGVVNANNAGTGVYITIGGVKIGTPATAAGYVGAGPGQVAINLYAAPDSQHLTVAQLEALTPIFTGFNVTATLGTAQGTVAPNGVFTLPTQAGFDGSVPVDFLFTATTGAGAFGASTIGVIQPITAAQSASGTAGPHIWGTADGTGITSLAIVVPEPSTIVLGGLGAAALLAFRRRK